MRSWIWLLLGLQISAANAQDHVLLGDVARISWWYSGRETGKTLEPSALDVYGVFQPTLQELRAFTSIESVRYRLEEARRETGCEFRLQVDLVGFAYDPQRYLGYQSRWEMSGYHPGSARYLNRSRIVSDFPYQTVQEARAQDSVERLQASLKLFLSEALASRPRCGASVPSAPKKSLDFEETVIEGKSEPANAAPKTAPPTAKSDPQRELLRLATDPRSWGSVMKFRQARDPEVTSYHQTPKTTEIHQGKRLPPEEVAALKKPIYRVDFDNCNDRFDWNDVVKDLEPLILYLAHEKNARVRITGHVNCDHCDQGPGSPKSGIGPAIWSQPLDCYGGYSDYCGSDKKVADLMYGRANAIRNFLIQYHGIDPSRIEVAAGTYQPDASNAIWGNRKVTIDYLN